MADIVTLRSNYLEKKNKYDTYIKGKNATTYENSDFYAIDFESVRKNISNFREEIINFSVILRNVKADTTFDNTIANLETLGKNINASAENLYSLEKEIYDCSKLVFDESLVEFKKLETANDILINNAESLFSEYYECSARQKILGRKIDRAETQEEALDYEKQYNRVERRMENILRNISSKITTFGSNNVELLALLKEGLEKTA